MKRTGLLLILLGIALGCENTAKNERQPTSDAAEERSADSLPASQPTADSETIAQEHEKRWQGDTLLIMDSQLTADPFGFGDNALGVLKAENAEIRKETVENRHVADQIDTLYHIRIAADYFKLYKTPSEAFLSEAQLKTKGFETKHGLHIGMSSIDFLEQMQRYNLDTVPAHVRLQSPVVHQYFDLRFEHKQLAEIRFKGYVD